MLGFYPVGARPVGDGAMPAASTGFTLSAALVEAGDSGAIAVQVRVKVSFALTEANDSGAAVVHVLDRLALALIEAGDFTDIVVLSGSGPAVLNSDLVPLLMRRMGRR